MIGSLDSSGTTFYLTDALGSLLASFSNTANSAALKSNQLFSPYGTARYTSGTLNTAKGFTGQYNDSLTGLDYFNARYYDPVVGVFLSADKAQGNMQGMNPYAYVQGNPETHSDPTGQYRAPSCLSSCSGGTTTTPISLPPPPSKQGTTSTSDGWPFGHIHPGPFIAQFARLFALVALGKTKSALNSLVTLVSLLNIPTLDLNAFPSNGYASLNDEAHGPFASLLEWLFGKETVDKAVSILGRGVDLLIGVSAVIDMFANNSLTQKVADAFTSAAYGLAIFKEAISEGLSNLLSKLFNLESSDLEDIITGVSLVLGGIGFAISLANAPFVPHAGNGNDTGNENRRHSNGGGPPFPPFPPTIPPAPNQVSNVGNQEIPSPVLGWNF